MMTWQAKALSIALALGAAGAGAAAWHAHRATQSKAHPSNDQQTKNFKAALREGARKDVDLRGVDLQGADLGGVDIESLFLHVQWTGRITITQVLKPNPATPSRTGKRVAIYDIVADIRGADASHTPPVVTYSKLTSHTENHEQCSSEVTDGTLIPDRSHDRKPEHLIFTTGPVNKDHYWFTVLLVSPGIPIKIHRTDGCGGHGGGDFVSTDQVIVETKKGANSIGYKDDKSSGTMQDAEGQPNAEWQTTLAWDFTIKPVAYDAATPPPSPSPCDDLTQDEDLNKLYREAHASGMKQDALEKLANQIAEKYFHFDVSRIGTIHVIDSHGQGHFGGAEPGHVEVDSDIFFLSHAYAIEVIGHELVHQAQFQRPPPGNVALDQVKVTMRELEAASWENGEGPLAEDVAAAMGPNPFLQCMDGQEQEATRLNLACMKFDALEALQRANSGPRAADSQQSLMKWKDPWVAAWLRSHPDWKTETPVKLSGDKCPAH